MTREQRDFLRKQIDARMRERLERALNAKAQAKADALERQRLEEAVASANPAGVPDDVDVEAVMVGDQRRSENHREALSEDREEARRRARRRLREVFDEGLQTLKPGPDLRTDHARLMV